MQEKSMSACSRFDHHTSKGSNLWRYYVFAALFIFSTSPKPFLNHENMNVVLIGFMMISPAFVWAWKIRKSHMYLYLFMATIVLFPPIINPESVRWSTVIYSLMFSFSFIAYDRVVRKSRIRIEQFEGAIRILLMGYFIVLLVQQFCVLTGLPVPFASNYNVADPWKLNSLSAEPSWAARSIGVLMFAYIALQEVRRREKYSFNLHFPRDIYVWVGFIWSMLTMQSATGIIFLMLVFLQVFRGKALFGALGLLLLFVLGEGAALGSNEQVVRLLSLFQAATTLDYMELVTADRSGSIRIVPLFILAERLEVFSISGLFGNGIDSVSGFMSEEIRGLPAGWSAGGLLQLWYDYGFLSFCLFVLFSMRVADALRSFSNFVVWVFIVVFSGLNIQYLWAYLILAASINYFRGQVEIIGSESKKFTFPFISSVAIKNT